MRGDLDVVLNFFFRQATAKVPEAIVLTGDGEIHQQYLASAYLMGDKSRALGASSLSG